MARRLVGVTMARNEADIIEAFVRHNLRYLDEMLVLDHGSSDATGDILRALQAEGLPLTLAQPPREPIFKQADWTTHLARQAFADHAADYVFPIDADEFLRADSRAAIDDALDRLSAPVLSLPWPTYVCRGDESGHPLHVMRWRVDVAPGPLRKVVLPRQTGMAQDWKIGQGNHLLWTDADHGKWDAGTSHPIPGVELAHLPLRSPEQLIAKVLIGRLTRRLTAGPGIDETTTSWHFRELYQRIMDGQQITPPVVREYAVAVYALGKKPGEVDVAQVRLVADPFAEPMPLRYTPNHPVKPALLLAAWALSLVERVTPQRPAQA